MDLKNSDKACVFEKEISTQGGQSKPLLFFLNTVVVVWEVSQDRRRMTLTADHYQRLFAHWRKKHAIQYLTGEEHNSRLSVFIANHDLISAHNADDRHSYKLGHNKFSDLTFEEFKELYMPHHERPNEPTPLEFDNELIDLVGTAPESRDWVAEGAVNSIQDQGHCGSCWAFSSTAAVESVDFIHTQVLKKLSEQYLVDCDYGGLFGNSGCDGGVINVAFEHMVEYGQCLESVYKYQGVQGVCQANTCDRSQVKIIRYHNVPRDNEDALKAAVGRQPVSVAIEADQVAFQFYKSGVLTGSGCGTNLDHAVVAVGYGVEDGLAYWNVRNSWGTTWGEGGYVRLERDVGGSGTCGIARMPSFPVYGNNEIGDDDEWIPSPPLPSDDDDVVNPNNSQAYVFLVYIGLGLCAVLLLGRYFFNQWRQKRWREQQELWHQNWGPGRQQQGNTEPLLG